MGAHWHGWFKVDKDMIDDPRLLEMAMDLSERYTLARHTGSGFMDLDGQERLQFFVSCSLGALVKLWRYADEHLRKDDTLPMTSQTLDAFVGLDGFFDAVPREWVDELDDGRVILPGYGKKNSLIAREKRRIKQQRYTATWRANRRASGEHAVSISHTANGEHSEHTGEHLLDQDIDIDKDKKKKAPAAPLVMHDSLPMTEWLEWIGYRKERKWPLSNLALKAQLAVLAQYDTETQRDMIRTSLNAGWRGIFPPKGRINGAQTKKPFGPVGWTPPPDDADPLSRPPPPKRDLA